MKNIALSLIFVLASCIHNPIRPLVNRGDLLFPHGTYRHNVNLVVTTSGTATAKKFSFDGIIQDRSEQIKMTALSPMGISVFRVTENLKTEEVNVEIFMSSLEKYKAQFTEYYKLIKILFRTSLTQDSDNLKVLKRTGDGYPELAEVSFHDQNNRLSFESYDQRNIPQRIEIENPHFKINIDLVEFEPEPERSDK